MDFWTVLGNLLSFG